MTAEKVHSSLEEAQRSVFAGRLSREQAAAVLAVAQKFNVSGISYTPGKVRSTPLTNEDMRGNALATLNGLFVDNITPRYYGSGVERGRVKEGVEKTLGPAALLNGLFGTRDLFGFSPTEDNPQPSEPQLRHCPDAPDRQGHKPGCRSRKEKITCPA